GSQLVDVLRGVGLAVAPAEARRLARWTHLRAEQVGRLADALLARANGRGDGEVTADDVTAVAVGIVGAKLSRLATALRTSCDWTHLVLPVALRQEITALI